MLRAPHTVILRTCYFFQKIICILPSLSFRSVSAVGRRLIVGILHMCSRLYSKKHHFWEQVQRYDHGGVTSLLGNYDRPTDQPTNRKTDMRVHVLFREKKYASREKSVAFRLLGNYFFLFKLFIDGKKYKTKSGIKEIYEI